ncbi:hypothetical protein LZ009_14345 [Ramlibacter sp. XY19]|uniref:hypothetical protein n=1 Tax=Ramlibacter paludis TaxID=2908000 RepID=UPI0023DCAD23|nr:hypothetical protein [Ramlibacter paludis]MCG2593958.1 hypothetical protein [Ramlibacter paludis]
MVIIHPASRRLPLLAVLLLAACTSVPSAPSTPIPTTDEALIARFRSCVTPTGPATTLPQLPAAEEPRFTGSVLPLSKTGTVMDGYNHELRLDAERRRGIIVQTGGIAGHKTVFGPFALERGCGA